MTVDAPEQERGSAGQEDAAGAATVQQRDETHSQRERPNGGNPEPEQARRH